MILYIRALALFSFTTIQCATAAMTPADNLLSNAHKPLLASVQQIKTESNLLFKQLGVPPWMQSRFELADKWDVKIAYSVDRIDSTSHAIILANRSISLKSIAFAIIIADGDVDIESGVGLLVISSGKITFTQNPNREWAGVFVTKSSLTSPWAANMVLHARKGAEFRSESVGILAFDTPVRAHRPIDIGALTGLPIFSDARTSRTTITMPPKHALSGFSFAGERCQNGAPLVDVAKHLPAMARSKASCPTIDLVVGLCRGSSGEEIWTVHMCENEVINISSRKIGGQSEFNFPPPLGAITPPGMR